MVQNEWVEGPDAAGGRNRLMGKKIPAVQPDITVDQVRRLLVE